MTDINKDELIKALSYSPAVPKELNSSGQCAPECFIMGLTKREMIAMHSMASWIIHHGNAKVAAISAVECADALLEELSK